MDGSKDLSQWQSTRHQIKANIRRSLCFGLDKARNTNYNQRAKYRMKKWMEKEFSQFVYYDDADGKIIGSVYKVGNSQSIYGASVDNNVLGHYIDCDFARRAVEQYWNIQDKTLLE